MQQCSIISQTFVLLLSQNLMKYWTHRLNNAGKHVLDWLNQVFLFSSMHLVINLSRYGFNWLRAAASSENSFYMSTFFSMFVSIVTLPDSIMSSARKRIRKFVP